MNTTENIKRENINAVERVMTTGDELVVFNLLFTHNGIGVIDYHI